MNIIVKSKDIDLGTKLKDYIYTKIEKLDHFFHNTQEIIIDLSETYSSSNTERFEANATVYASGAMLHAKERAGDSYAVVDMIYDKLQIQLKKHKEKMQNRRTKIDKRRALKGVGTNSATSNELMTESETDHFIKKPMDVEEAAALLKEKALSFLVFRDMRTEKISVIYPVNNRELGLIET
ncbi:MAG: ribosome-associated translation inhibitor RaiA [bacterium]